jgi:hypothetical protein
MPSRLKLAVMLASLTLCLLAAASTASAWAPESSATIHPGVMTFTNASSFVDGASQCTANFVFTDSSGNVYLGQAAHCGDSGSGFMNTDGDALGVLSTVEFAPLPAANGVGTLAKELSYANQATGLGLKVAAGTTPFNPVPIPPAQ